MTVGRKDLVRAAWFVPRAVVCVALCAFMLAAFACVPVASVLPAAAARFAAPWLDGAVEHMARADDVFRANGATGGVELVRALATFAVCAAALAAPLVALARCIGAS